MSISNDLMYAILSMDAYNQGYDRVVKHDSLQIGLATRIDEKGDAEAQAAGFYAAAYSFNGETVISYRGTNVNAAGLPNALDVANGWLTGAGDFRASQFELATQFLAHESN